MDVFDVDRIRVRKRSITCEAGDLADELLGIIQDQVPGCTRAVEKFNVCRRSPLGFGVVPLPTVTGGSVMIPPWSSLVTLKLSCV
jgi:hypothetical protein